MDDRPLVEQMENMESVDNLYIPESIISQMEEPESEPEPAPALQEKSRTVDAPQAKPAKQAGWNQGDGRRADQVVIYEPLPESMRRYFTPTKGTHFRFQSSRHEAVFLKTLERSGYHAVYHATGKRDIILTDHAGNTVGAIHFLHVNGPDIQQPSKYYIKLYFFDFRSPEALHEVKQAAVSFFAQLEAAAKRSKLSKSSKSSKSSKLSKSSKSAKHSKQTRRRKNSVKRRSSSKHK